MTDILKVLIEDCGFDVSKKWSSMEQTLLHYALWVTCGVDEIRYLVEDVKVDVNAQDKVSPQLCFLVTDDAATLLASSPKWFLPFYERVQRDNEDSILAN